MKTFKVLGINDDASDCECCGKQGLARVVWIENIETGEIKHFGTSCAQKPAKGFGINHEIKQAIRSFDANIQCIWMAAHRLYKALGGSYFQPEPYVFETANKALMDECFASSKAELIQRGIIKF